MYKYLIPIYWTPGLAVSNFEGCSFKEPLILFLIDSVSGEVLSYSFKYGLQGPGNGNSSIIVLRQVISCELGGASRLTRFSVRLRPQLAQYGLSLNRRMRFRSYNYDWYKAIMILEAFFYDWDYDFLSIYRFNGKILESELLTLLDSAVIKFNSAVRAGAVNLRGGIAPA